MIRTDVTHGLFAEAQIGAPPVILRQVEGQQTDLFSVIENLLRGISTLRNLVKAVSFVDSC